MPLINLRGEAVDGIRLLAPMYYPQDEASRDQFVAVCDCSLRVTHADKAGAPLVHVPTEALRSVLSALSNGDFRELTENRKLAGNLAGDVFLSVYMMSVTGAAEPSLRKAIYSVARRAEADKKADVPAEQRGPTSEATVRKYWEQCRSVAHFWGAYRLLQAYPPSDMAPVEDVFFGGDLEPFLTVTELLLQFGIAFVPSRLKNAEPLVDADSAWRIANLKPRITLRPTISALPAWLQQALESYQKRQYPD